MDKWQRTATYEIPNKPQRIRGLAGSGKTIVLALKALIYISKIQQLILRLLSTVAVYINNSPV